ncbi:alpha/beta hydrolase family protein [Xanthomarina sp. F2636L]|uniref:alpha/beta hydrolase family protein n=1 Tax=Xanthomarina sp. F2636L TaxID=2996018 RepID=UPI00225E12B8|nr:alpha/beta hydrolase [Xanthomarina sp. F2636L]MCX7550611.1 alpha/beta hydrolase [Xanthomarina sp. F2636L]
MKQILLYLALFYGMLVVAQENIISEEILIMNDSVKLPGTLSYNKNLKSQPLAIFIHGSGNVDRNGNQAGVNINANYIKQLSDSLNGKGIALYRYDKRTSTEENMKFVMTDLNFDRFVDDANLAINKFKDDNRFNSITLIGHSQGSLVAMLAAQENVDKYVSLAGISENMGDFIINSYKLYSDEMGNMAKQQIDELKETRTIETINPALAHLFSKPNQPFFITWMAYNPSEEIKKLDIPVLIINGTKDLQVKFDEANKLHEAKPDSELVFIDNMNHVLKDIEKDEDNMKSYYSPDYPLSIDLINTLEVFIKK